ncbi:PREDICTED: uncharacterized protein LOC105366074 [Ceratosolen solmsi marchali]|uniref:Uncharacterized protein LOC105366074 n=1 Tax=Ceratosolen solmsi marchali TaxID=326594 RepID=A0AAJ7E018_9HYME|nr:PREDICTED: uncharacterized protein LOC105366074 [Ceratosolen solmsi marchali]
MQFYAPGGELIKSLIKHINFTIVPEIGSLSQYGILLPNGSATGLLARIKNNKLDAIAFGAFVFHTSYITEVDRTMYLNLEKICAVVPLIRSKRLYIQRSVWISCITIICLVILVWLFSFILRPHGTFSWNLLHISLIVLGISVPGQPTILRERFVYGSVIVVAFLYSSSIFAQLMSINFHATSFKSFNSLEELNESGLIPVLHPNLYNLTFKFGNKILQSMGAKSVLRSDYSEICPIWLWEKANVTCIIGSTMYDFLSKLYRDNPKRVMKLASPCFWSASRALILRKASPYTHRFSTIILRVIEAGHMKRATNLYVFDFIQRRNISQESDETLSEKRMAVNVQQMTYSDVTDAFAVMIIGTLFSICFFLGECVIFNVRSRYKRKSIALVRYWCTIK